MSDTYVIKMASTKPAPAYPPTDAPAAPASTTSATTNRTATTLLCGISEPLPPGGGGGDSGLQQGDADVRSSTAGIAGGRSRRASTRSLSGYAEGSDQEGQADVVNEEMLTTVGAVGGRATGRTAGSRAQSTGGSGKAADEKLRGAVELLIALKDGGTPRSAGRNPPASPQVGCRCGAWVRTWLFRMSDDPKGAWLPMHTGA
jgi:hypothetical protein